jgi:quinol monooxygenase YgiN
VAGDAERHPAVREEGNVSEVILIPVFEVKPGRLEDFKAAAARIIERVEGEPDTLRYDQHLSADGTRMVNIEVFRDADAFVFHNRNVADLAPALFDAGPIAHVDVIGEVNEAMRAELASANVTYLAVLGSVPR